VTLRVVVVEDSPFARSALKEILEAERDIEVVGMADDGRGALAAVKRYAPDLVTMDIQMAGGGGLAAIEEIMGHAPVPILVVTALPSGRDSELTFEALRRGALDVAAKPSGPSSLADAARLRRQVRLLAGVPVVRHIATHRATKRAATAQPSASTPIVGIAASAGGPITVAQILGALPASLPACVALVQHLPAGYAAFFATFLRRHTTLEVVVAMGATEPRRGVVIVAPDDKHLVLTADGMLTATAEPPESGYRPSATVLFRSLARFAGAAAVGVVLTGIGDDGAAGLAEMRRAGATTIAQDARTSIVFGMPRAAIDAGAAAKVLALDDIASTIASTVSG